MLIIEPGSAIEPEEADATVTAEPAGTEAANSQEEVANRSKKQTPKATSKGKAQARVNPKKKATLKSTPASRTKTKTKRQMCFKQQKRTTKQWIKNENKQTYIKKNKGKREIALNIIKTIQKQIEIGKIVLKIVFKNSQKIVKIVLKIVKAIVKNSLNIVKKVNYLV